MSFTNWVKAGQSERPDDSDYVPLATLDNSDGEPTRNDSQENMNERNRPAGPYRSFTRRFKEVCRSNTGLLLISLSQGFTSLMGVFVKKLNELDPPVPPLEVSWFMLRPERGPDERSAAHLGSHGHDLDCLRRLHVGASPPPARGLDFERD